MTVKELIDKLKTCNQNKVVEVEGCDCIRKATGVTEEDDTVCIDS